LQPVRIVEDAEELEQLKKKLQKRYSKRRNKK
jgi:hypothetical protein